MLSHFFILSPRGDTIISKDYRGDSPPGAAESFFRRVKFGGPQGSQPPVFQVGAVTRAAAQRVPVDARSLGALPGRAPSPIRNHGGTRRMTAKGPEAYPRRPENPAALRATRG